VTAVVTSQSQHREAEEIFDPGSFRDPGGRVFELDGHVLRTVNRQLADDFGWVQASGLLDALADAGKCVRTAETRLAHAAQFPSAWKVLESERVPYITYPYEWTFAALKRAALFHLDLHLEVLGRGGNLIDASAYNVQFRGAAPVFIDVLSLRRYRDGEVWAGHRQFCEQFLNPLLLRACLGIPHNAWYRGALEGIRSAELLPLLRLRHKASWSVLMHLVAPEMLARSAVAGRVAQDRVAARAALPKKSLVAMLQGLRRFISALRPARARPSQWADYAIDNTYAVEEAERKRAVVQGFVERARPARVLDLGCNTGEYAELMLRAGASSAVGLEADPQAAEQAFERAANGRLDFLPLVMDAANASPSQGWRNAERPSFAERARFDAVVALAFEHHLAIGRNVPLAQVIAWIVEFAPRGLIEFVPKGDPTIRRMLALRDLPLEDYSESSFRSLLAARARITREDRISATGRTLFAFERA